MNMNITSQASGLPAKGPIQLLDSGFDEDGYLTEPSNWSETLAEQIAIQEGLESLSPDHWRVIRHLREHYYHIGGVPAMRLVCRRTGLDWQELHRLFSGGCRSIWRIAGLPNPGEEAKAYFQ